jgi:hypothetical protein
MDKELRVSDNNFGMARLQRFLSRRAETGQDNRALKRVRRPVIF